MARIIFDNATFVAEYENLSAGDLVVGRLRIRPGEEHILLDLAARGVKLIPSAFSQVCSRSKVLQARVLGRFMVPGTAVVYNRHDMLAVVNDYGSNEIGRVVCKMDRANAGQGILLFQSAEEVYSNAVLGVLPYPFVVQPFIAHCRDVRSVFLGDRHEAYSRHNPSNFRHNLHCGGGSSPFELDEGQLGLCRQIMERAGFPYAHVDLLLDPAGNSWLSEINLRGGLRGATISQRQYLDAVENIHARMLADLLAETGRGSQQ